jgi:hypothetical protein
MARFVRWGRIGQWDGMGVFDYVYVFSVRIHVGLKTSRIRGAILTMAFGSPHCGTMKE